MKIKNEKLIEFVNLVNECCDVMDDNYVSKWLHLPNPDLNMEMPIDIFNNEGTERLYRLLYFIEIGEADLN
tara:strand:- start:29918 stop:30130 length:213 start_codon:yes stop_codon:yes gene_type:complete